MVRKARLLTAKRQVFKDEFGLETRFVIYRDNNNGRRDSQDRIILAYIVLPPAQESRAVFSRDDDGIFSIGSSIVIDAFPEPTTKEKELFQKAMDTLHLQPMQYDLQQHGDPRGQRPDLRQVYEAPGKWNLY